MICGYAEILKHSIIKDKKFFDWLNFNSKSILNKEKNKLIYAIKKSCEIKIHFVKILNTVNKFRLSLKCFYSFIGFR